MRMIRGSVQFTFIINVLIHEINTNLCLFSQPADFTEKERGPAQSLIISCFSNTMDRQNVLQFKKDHRTLLNERSSRIRQPYRKNKN